MNLGSPSIVCSLWEYCEHLPASRCCHLLSCFEAGRPLALSTLAMDLSMASVTVSYTCFNHPIRCLVCFTT